MKEEALKLAEQLEDDAKYGECDWTNPKVSADMIRRLVEELDATEKAYKWTEIARNAPTKPLSVEEIEGAFYKKCWYYDEDEKFDYYGFAREIEERHGIK